MCEKKNFFFFLNFFWQEFEKFSDDVSKFIKADKDGKWGVVSVLSQFSYLDTDKNSSISYEEMKEAILKLKQ